VSEALSNPCNEEHDPLPMVTSGIAMAQVTFGSRTRFDPRKQYCQKWECYEKTDEDKAND